MNTLQIDLSPYKSNGLSTNNDSGLILLLGMSTGTSYTYVDNNKINYQTPVSQHSGIRLCEDLESTDYIALSNITPVVSAYEMKELSVAPPKDYRGRYAKIAASDWFKRDYYGKSIGDIITEE